MGQKVSVDESPKKSSSFDSISSNPKINAVLKRLETKHTKAQNSTMRRCHSASSLQSDDLTADYGLFVDFETSTSEGKTNHEPLQRSLSLPAPATQPPIYVLESSIDTQHLWYATAGRRPRQPEHEREYFERLWTKNFEQSNVKYGENPSTLMTPRQQENIPPSEFGGTEILFRGKGPFSNSVSKSFLDHEIASLNIQLPRFRIVKSQEGETYAEFLVVVSLGSKTTVTFGIWRRHSDFHSLASKIQTEHSLNKTYKNALLSWQCLLNRKRWFRCLDKDYISLKCFLLERFIQDLLFESSSPDLISDFLGLE